jgi:hypothetical protein
MRPVLLGDRSLQNGRNFEFIHSFTSRNKYNADLSDVVRDFQFDYKNKEGKTGSLLFLRICKLLYNKDHLKIQVETK